MILQAERAELCKYSKEYIRKGLTRGTGGNLSIRNPKENLVAITPSGVPYESLTEEMIVVIDMKGNVVDGDLIPSSEVGMHLAVYNNRPEFNALVHAHSTFATTLACLREDLPAVDYLVAFSGGSTVRCAEYATYGTNDLAINALKAMEGRNAVLLANHGINCAGPNMMTAFANTEQLEFVCECYIRAKSAGTPVIISGKFMDEMLAKASGYGQKVANK